MTKRGLENASIPVGGEFWRALGKNGTLAAGYYVVGAHAVVLLVDVLLVLGGSEDLAERWAIVSKWATILLPLLALCLIGLGEAIRRGDWRGPSGHKPDAVLPQGSNTVAVTMLPLAWHVLWGSIALVVAGALLVGIVADSEATRFAVWSVNGVIAAGSAGALFGSLVKKWSWLGGGSERASGAKLAHPALARRHTDRGRLFWRWVGFRWRLDLWCCALGLVAAWLGGLMLATREMFPGSAESATVVAWVVIPAGVVLTLGGLWMTTQFWRAGEDLAVQESFA